MLIWDDVIYAASPCGGFPPKFASLSRLRQTLRWEDLPWAGEENKIYTFLLFLIHLRTFSSKGYLSVHWSVLYTSLLDICGYIGCEETSFLVPNLFVPWMMMMVNGDDDDSGEDDSGDDDNYDDDDNYGVMRQWPWALTGSHCVCPQTRPKAWTYYII